MWWKLLLDVVVIYLSVIITSVSLCPIMWYLWAGSMAGNANFYFATSLAVITGRYWVSFVSFQQFIGVKNRQYQFLTVYNVLSDWRYVDHERTPCLGWVQGSTHQGYNVWPSKVFFWYTIHCLLSWLWLKRVVLWLDLNVQNINQLVKSDRNDDYRTFGYINALWHSCMNITPPHLVCARFSYLSLFI